MILNNRSHRYTIRRFIQMIREWYALRSLCSSSLEVFELYRFNNSVLQRRAFICIRGGTAVLSRTCRGLAVATHEERNHEQANYKLHFVISPQFVNLRLYDFNRALYIVGSEISVRAGGVSKSVNESVRSHEDKRTSREAPIERRCERLAQGADG